MWRVGWLLLLGGCELYFGSSASPDAQDGATAPDAAPSAVLARPCLRTIVAGNLEPGGPEDISISYACEGEHVVVERVLLAGTSLAGDNARGDYQDWFRRSVLFRTADPFGPDGVIDVMEHFPQIWIFQPSVGNRVSFERPFDDIWLGDLDGDGVGDFVLAGDGAIRIASADSQTYGFPLDVAATDETELLSGAPYRELAVAQLDGAGLPDLAYLSGGQGLPTQLGFAVQTAPGTFSVTDTATEPEGPILPMVVADVDGDGVADVIGAVPRVFVRSSRYGALVFLDEPAVAVAAGDVDGDGVADALFLTADHASVRQLHLGTHAGVLALTSSLLVADGGDALVAAQLDGDHRADVVLLQGLAQATSRLVLHLSSTY